MTRYLMILGVLALTAVAAVAQTKLPPEWTGPPKKFSPLPQDFKDMYMAMPKNWEHPEDAKKAMALFTAILKKYPTYSDGYFMRAAIGCSTDIANRQEIISDVDAAIRTHGKPTFDEQYDSLGEHYSMKAKLDFLDGRLRTAMDDLEAGMKQDIDSAKTLFNNGNTKPDAAPPIPCKWGLSDVNKLVQSFPKDYRALLFRGLYLSFFAEFSPECYAAARKDFQAAALLNPRSPFPYYYIGRLYTTQSFWKAFRMEQGRNELRDKAITAFSEAIRADNTFFLAYSWRADAYLNTKRSREALQDYDRVLALKPKFSLAYHDRALAKEDLGNYVGAISDFTDSLGTGKQDDDQYVGTTYEERADAEVKIGEYREAVQDYSQAIRSKLANLTFLLSLKQIRALYPEFNDASDEYLIRKIRLLFWPQYDYATLAKELNENGSYQISLLHDYYQKRGDAYLRIGDYRDGVRDLNRIFNGIPNFAAFVERWRSVGTLSNNADIYLDAKTATFGGRPNLWIKTVQKAGDYTIDSFEFGCANRQVNVASSLSYDKDGRLLRNSQLASGWEQIVPDTIAESLYNGACSDLSN